MDSKGGVQQFAEVELAAVDKEAGAAVRVALIEAGQGVGDFAVELGREGLQAREVVVPVAFDRGDAEAGHDGKVLQEGYGADVAKVFPALAQGRQGAGTVFLARCQQAFGSEALKYAFAVLVGGASVAEVEGVGKVFHAAVGLVNNDRGLGELEQLGPAGRLEGDVSAYRLFHKE